MEPELEVLQTTGCDRPQHLEEKATAVWTGMKPPRSPRLSHKRFKKRLLKECGPSSKTVPTTEKLSYGSQGFVPFDATTDGKVQPQSSGAEVEL